LDKEESDLHRAAVKEEAKHINGRIAEDCDKKSLAKTALKGKGAKKNILKAIWERSAKQ